MAAQQQQQQSRSTLNSLFANGARPTGENFASAWLSFLHQTEDGLSFDGKNLVISSKTGITLGKPEGGPGGTPGTLRFNGTHVQYYDPGISDFKDIAGDAGAFLPVDANTVAFGGGNVGIGTFTPASPPKHLLEIPLKDNSVAGQQVLLGNLVIHNGPLGAPGAYIGNNNFSSYALFQDSFGTTKINAGNATASQLSLAINEVDKFLITQDGNMVLWPTPSATIQSVAIHGEVNIGIIGAGHTLTITNRTDLTTGVPGTSALTLNGDQTGAATAIPTLTVNGVALNTSGSGGWATTSDIRVKKEIRPFKEGLQKLLLFDPVVYKFNGKAGTNNNGKDYFGLIAQDVRKIMPELTISRYVKFHAEDTKESEVLAHDLSPLTFIFINAIKELNARLEKLEK